MSRWRAILITLVLLNAARGDESPADLFPPRPDIESAPVYRVVVPEGFSEISVGSHTALVQPADEKWVRRVLDELEPTERPTTGPSDLIDNAIALRPQITAELVSILGLDSAERIDPIFDRRLIPTLELLSEMRMPVYFMVITRQRLRELVRGGWDNPHYHYNRTAGEVAFNPSLLLTDEGTMPDLVWPFLVDETDPQEKREQELTQVVRNIEGRVIDTIAGRAHFLVYSTFLHGINQAALADLQLAADQQWLAVGLAGVLAARYGGQIIGSPYHEMFEQLVLEHPHTPVRVATVNLLNPPSPRDLRPQYVPHYIDAMRRQSLIVVNDLVTRGGDEAITKTLAAIRAEKPVDGEALVKLIREKTGVDLSEQMTPGLGGS
jgi:hypothetical protein